MDCIDLSGPFMFSKCVRQWNLNSEGVSEVYFFYNVYILYYRFLICYYTNGNNFIILLTLPVVKISLLGFSLWCFLLMFQKGYRGGTVQKPLDEMYKLITNELRFYDIHSELLGNASLQKWEQVWYCWSELQKRSVKKLSFECILNIKIIAGIIRIHDFLWQLPSYSLSFLV